MGLYWVGQVVALQAGTSRQGWVIALLVPVGGVALAHLRLDPQPLDPRCGPVRTGRVGPPRLDSDGPSPERGSAAGPALRSRFGSTIGLSMGRQPVRAAPDVARVQTLLTRRATGFQDSGTRR